MLLRTDPFSNFETIARGAFADRVRSSSMPLDAYRRDDTYVMHFDLPGVDPASIDLTVEKDVLTVVAERSWDVEDDTRVLVSERPQGSYRRQIVLGKALDTDRVTADYTDGVLTVTVPVAEQSKPRKVEVTSGGAAPAIDAQAEAA